MYLTKKSRLKRRIVKGASCIIAASLTLGMTLYSGSCDSKKPDGKKKSNNVKAEKSLLDTAFLPNVDFNAFTLPNTTTTTTITSTTTTTEETTTSTLSTTDVVTSIILELTEVPTTAVTEMIIETPVEVYEPVIEEPIPTYVVYKPTTHYIHTSTCRWCDSACYEITSTEGIEARSCSECNPDIEIVTPYIEPVQPDPVVSTTDTAISVTDYEYVILCNLVAGEYGSNNISTYDKGAVVAVVIHRLWEGTRWTGGADATIYNVINAPGQFSGKNMSSSFSSKVTEGCKEAVTYALNNIGDYEYYTNPDGTSVYNINSFYGDGRYNWFRHS